MTLRGDGALRAATMCLCAAVFALPIGRGWADASPQCPAGADDAYVCAAFQEAQVARDFPQALSRDGDRLDIALRDGRHVRYTDVHDLPEDTEKHLFRLAGYYPDIGFALIVERHREGNAKFLLNLRSGSQVLVLSAPIVSPDGQRLVVANADIFSQHAVTGIDIYRIDGDQLKREYSSRVRDRGAAAPAWVSARELHFTEVSANGDGKTGERPRVLKLGWLLSNWSLE